MNLNYLLISFGKKIYRKSFVVQKKCSLKKYGPPVLIQQTWKSIEIDFKYLIKLSYNLFSVMTIGNCFAVLLFVHLLKKVKFLSFCVFYLCPFVGIRKSFFIGTMLSMN